MDLAALLDCGAAGHPTLAAWYGDIFQAMPAAVTHAMPHTNVAWLPAADGDETAALLQALRARLGRDDVPEDIARIEAWPVAPARFGLIAVFAEGAAPDLAPLRALLTSAGRILLVWRADAMAEPVMTLHG